MEKRHLVAIYNAAEHLTVDERDEILNNENPTSFISFEDERFWLIFEWAFKLKKSERLKGLTVSLDGINAFIEKKKSHV